MTHVIRILFLVKYEEAELCVYEKGREAKPQHSQSVPGVECDWTNDVRHHFIQAVRLHAFQAKSSFAIYNVLQKI